MTAVFTKAPSHFTDNFKRWTAAFAITVFLALTMGCNALKERTAQKDPFKSFNFSLNDSESIFKYSKNGTIMFWYCVGGGKKENYNNEPFFNLMIMPNDRTLLEGAEFMADYMKNQTIKKQSDSTTNGFPSFQREVYGEKDGKPAVLFQHLVLMDDKVIVMSGIAHDNFDKNVDEFKKLSSTLKKK